MGSSPIASTTQNRRSEECIGLGLFRAPAQMCATVYATPATFCGRERTLMAGKRMNGEGSIYRRNPDGRCGLPPSS